MSLASRIYYSAYLAYHVSGQEQYPFRPLPRILADQSRRVQQTVHYAYYNVPYYRETLNRMGLTPADFVTARDLARLPLLERRLVQQDPEYFCSRKVPLSHHYRHRNSGSTGRPCVFYHDYRSLAMSGVHSARSRAAYTPLIGRRTGFRKTLIFSAGGSQGGIHAFYRENIWLPPGIALQRQYLSPGDAIEENIHRMQEFRPEVILSLGSYLARLFAHMQARGERLESVRALTYIGDTLPDAARRMIQDDFGLPAFSSYEATEAYNIAFECEAHRGLHVNLDICPLRIADSEGRTLPVGETGQVIISDLVNRGTVLLNYPLGDTGSFLREPCSCGRSLPMLAMLQVRGADWIRLPSGRLVSADMVVPLFKVEDALWQWQIVQESETQVRVLLVAGPQADREMLHHTILDGLRGVLSDEMQINLEFVDKVEHTAAGKVRKVISRLSSITQANEIPGWEEGANR